PFLSNSPATTNLSPLSLHDALPIFTIDLPVLQVYDSNTGCYSTKRQSILDWIRGSDDLAFSKIAYDGTTLFIADQKAVQGRSAEDRKSTRLNSSHVAISYAVFCLKK